MIFKTFHDLIIFKDLINLLITSVFLKVKF